MIISVIMPIVNVQHEDTCREVFRVYGESLKVLQRSAPSGAGLWSTRDLAQVGTNRNSCNTLRCGMNTPVHHHDHTADNLPDQCTCCNRPSTRRASLITFRYVSARGKVGNMLEGSFGNSRLQAPKQKSDLESLWKCRIPTNAQLALPSLVSSLASAGRPRITSYDP